MTMANQENISISDKEESTPSLSPTKYEDYIPSIKEEEQNQQKKKSFLFDNEKINIQIDFAKSPLIKVESDSDNDLYQDEIDSMEIIHQSYIYKEQTYLVNSNQFLMKFNMNSEYYKIFTNEIMRISWQLCLSRRVFQ